MASLREMNNGTKRIQFTHPDGKRKTLYLGKVSKRAAENTRIHVEELLGARTGKVSPPPATVQWLAETEDVLHAKLVKVGLVLPRVPQEKVRLGPWLDHYIESRNDLKPATKTIMGHTVRNLKKHFGKNCDVTTIDHADADNFRQWLIGHKFGKSKRKLAPATIHKRVQTARSFFKVLKRHKIIDENPFEGVKATASGTRKKLRFITQDQIADVLDACPDYHWRSIVALARYGGLRCPSEVLSLTWNDIDWEKGRIIVHSPKTEHHPDGATRTIPLFPELREILSEADQLADPGTVYVVDERYRKAAQGPNGWMNANLRTTFIKIIKRAGLTPWPRPFQNLRASRETELMDEHKIHVVCKWIGNTPAVAMKHYLQIRESDFEKATNATQNATQHMTAEGGNREQTENAQKENPYKTSVLRGSEKSGMGVTGFEPVTSSMSTTHSNQLSYTPSVPQDGRLDHESQEVSMRGYE